jgi:kynureninase
VTLRNAAARLDAADPLAPVRDEFVIGEGPIYLDGNSLGRLPKRTVERVRSVVEDEWANELVLGWDHWLDIGIDIGDQLAPLIGAEPGPDIITDTGNFPSDRYVLEAVASAAGGRLLFAPEDPTASDIEALTGPMVGLVSVSHVGYRSGTMLDAAAITSAAHRAGALMLWDLAHSAGAVPVGLGSWGADLAVGCTYKYLNAGPGAPAFLFVRRDLITELEQPISGWYAHADQFSMAADFVPKDTIGRFIVGTPSILAMVAAAEGIGLTASVGIEAVRNKSLALSDFFIDAVRQTLGTDVFTIVTPLDHERRGSQVSVRHPEAYRISLALRDAGVIPDFRAPDIVRFGFTPLYTTFTEAAEAVEILSKIMRSRSYERFGATRMGVT